MRLRTSTFLGGGVHTVRESLAEREKNQWEGKIFAFHLHKELRIKGSRQVLPPHSQSDGGLGRLTTDRRCFFSLQFPLSAGEGREKEDGGGGGVACREVAGGAELF